MAQERKNNYLKKIVDERSFPELSFEQQLEVVTRTRGSKKINLIISSPHSLKLTRRLSEEDIYLTLKEVGEIDASPLFELTNYKQAQYIYDLEWWKQDTLLPKKIVFWFAFMLESDGMKFFEWARNITLETLTAIFQQLIIVHRFENIDDLTGDTPELHFFTIDNVNFIEFINPDHSPVVSRALSILLGRLHHLYHDLVDNVHWQLKYETAEEASFWRQSRMAEKGFPEINEAMRIYQPIPAKFRTGTQLGDVRPTIIEGNIKSPEYVLSTQKKTLFLSKVLSDERTISYGDRIRFELAHLSHKILVADGMTPDYNDLQTVLKKAFGTVNIGLELLSKDDLQKAIEILDTNFIEHIFRVGFEPISKLSKRAQTIFKGMAQQDQAFWVNFLEMPLSDIVTSLLQNRPKCRLPQTDSQILIEKEFESVFDIEKASQYLEQAEFIIELFRERYALNVDIPAMIDSPLSRAIVAEVNWIQLLNSMFIHYMTDETIKVMPVDGEQLHVFYIKYFQHQVTGKMTSELQIEEHFINDFNQSLIEQGKLELQEISLLNSIEEFAFTKFLEQFEDIVPTREILTDFRFFPHVWFKKDMFD